GIPAREDHPGPFCTCPTCRFESNAGATADHDNGLPKQLRFTVDGRGSHGAHGSSASTSILLATLPEVRKARAPSSALRRAEAREITLTFLRTRQETNLRREDIISEAARRGPNSASSRAVSPPPSVIGDNEMKIGPKAHKPAASRIARLEGKKIHYLTAGQ